MKSASDLHETLVTAIEEGDVSRAIEAEAQLQTSDESLEALYDELAVAISNDDFEKAKTVLRALRSRLETVREDQRLTLQEAMLARDKTELSDDEFETVENLISTMGAASLQRFSFFSELIMYLTQADADGTSQSDQQPLETISDMKSASQEIEEATTDAQTVTSQANLPPDVTILGIQGTDTQFRPGRSFELTLILTNVGDMDARGITATLSVDDDIDVSPPIITLGSLGSGQRTAANFTLTASSPGTYSVHAAVNSDNTDRSVQEETISVVESDAPRSVVDVIGGDDGVGFTDVLQAIELYNSGEPIPNTDGQQVGFQDVLQVIDAYNRG
ncbi:CARDB domain-containing protein [Halorubrum ezzemoulense]|uniref:CARDB domain-containing protein n=1 Tax=Halorubrum ezzemoulense TaxID=337243 RepID=UPI00232A9320|nr:CARDB domain-containing protein [Halorubrum ezzemoulense]MDB2265825.1 CARDB domain-containing protein [Halorubrum ezzemoulense]